MRLGRGVRNLGARDRQWALAVAAIWGDRIKAKIFRPVLSVELVSAGGADLARARYPDGTFIDCRYYHLRVTNKKPHSPAVRVQLLILSIANPSPAGVPQLVWNEPLPLRWKQQEFQPLLPTIGPGERQADLLSVNAKSELTLLTLFQVFSFPQVYTGPTQLWITARAEGENWSAPRSSSKSFGMVSGTVAEKRCSGTFDLEPRAEKGYRPSLAPTSAMARAREARAHARLEGGVQRLEAGHAPSSGKPGEVT